MKVTGIENIYHNFYNKFVHVEVKTLEDEDTGQKVERIMEVVEHKDVTYNRKGELQTYIFGNNFEKWG